MSLFSRPGADVFVPDGLPLEKAAARITHLGIGAHQDDLEFMAMHGILACYETPGLSFGGVVCTNGSGSARQGRYAACSDEEMQGIRREEQRAAARLGRYGLMVQLDHPTAELKSAEVNPLTADLQALFTLTSPRVVYTHNPIDKHESHLHVFAAVVEALRSLPPERRPGQFFGCEVWRGLDWMNDSEKVAHDVSARPELSTALNALFDSQIAGGKRYDLATEGRRRANATYFTAHRVDYATHLSYAMDLTPLLRDDTLDVMEFSLGFIDRFRSSVELNLQRALRR
jgi:LmbE family N-acetylglucosaminyl deacetylase